MMKKGVGWRGLAIALLTPTLACGPKTQNIQALAASVESTNAPLGAVLKLGYPSCVRAAEYQMLKEAIDALPESREAQEKDFAKALTICEQAKRVRSSTLQAASTITAFAVALDALARNEPVQHVPTLPGLPENTDDLAAATDDTVKTIATWATAGYRRKQLEKAIFESAKPVSAVLHAISATVREVHARMLAQEKQNLLELFRRYDRAAPADPILAGLRSLELQRRLVDINTRIARTVQLLTRLDHLILAHDRLVHAEGALRRAELLPELRVALADTLLTSPLPDDPPPLSIPQALPSEQPAPADPSPTPAPSPAP